LVSEGIVLRPLRSPELIGWENELYAETAKRFFSAGMTITQAVLASIYTLTVAVNTSNYVRDPLSVAIIDGNGIRLEDNAYVKKLEERLDDYETQINRVFLACADTTVSVPSLEDQLDQFKAAALQLHKAHIDRQAAATSLEDILAGRSKGKLPKGPIMFSADGKVSVEHDRDKIQKSDEQWKITKILGGAGPVKLTVHCKCGDFQVLLGSAISIATRNDFECPKCGAMTVVTELRSEDFTLES
jgi:hypothetical protein